MFTLLCSASKGFMKAFKGFIKPFEAPQKSVKMKVQVNFLFSRRVKASVFLIVVEVGTILTIASLFSSAQILCDMYKGNFVFGILINFYFWKLIIGKS